MSDEQPKRDPEGRTCDDCHALLGGECDIGFGEREPEDPACEYIAAGVRIREPFCSFCNDVRWVMIKGDGRRNCPLCGPDSPIQAACVEAGYIGRNPPDVIDALRSSRKRISVQAKQLAHKLKQSTKACTRLLDIYQQAAQGDRCPCCFVPWTEPHKPGCAWTASNAPLGIGVQGPHADPADCPTWHDHCHCTVATLVDAFERAESAEAHAEKTDAAALQVARDHAEACSVLLARAEAAEECSESTAAQYAALQSDYYDEQDAGEEVALRIAATTKRIREMAHEPMCWEYDSEQAASELLALLGPSDAGQAVLDELRSLREQVRVQAENLKQYAERDVSAFDTIKRTRAGLLKLKRKHSPHCTGRTASGCVLGLCSCGTTQHNIRIDAILAEIDAAEGE